MSKDKQGIVTTDVLTKAWTDWVDYWAVDFDYMSRREIIKVAKESGLAGDSPSLPPAGDLRGPRRFPGSGTPTRWKHPEIGKPGWFVAALFVAGLNASPSGGNCCAN